MVKIKLDSDLKKELMNNIYLKYCIVNISEVYNIEKELITSNIYLPNLLRRFISNDYYTHITNSKVSEKISKNRRFTRRQSVEEFISWIKNNPDYNKLLDAENLSKMNEELATIKEL